MIGRTTVKHRKINGHPGSENLKPWKPGQSGNPKGRPSKKACLTTLLKKEIERICPDDKKGRTWKELIVLSTMQLAIRGNSTALREVWARVDGNVTQSLDVGGQVQTEHIDIENEADRFMRELDRIAARQEATRDPGARSE